MGHPAAIQFLRELIRVQRPHVPHSNKIDDDHCAFTVNCSGRSRGLCLLWNSTSNCVISSYSQKHVDAIILEDEGNWRFTGFYGFPERSRRRLSWNLMRMLAVSNTLPWVVMGDFNNLLTPEDKGGPSILIGYSKVSVKQLSIVTFLM